MNFLIDRGGKWYDSVTGKRWIGTGSNLTGQPLYGHAAAIPEEGGARTLIEEMAGYKCNHIRVMQADGADAPTGIWIGTAKDEGWLRRFDVTVVECEKNDVRIFLDFDKTQDVLMKAGIPNGLAALKVPGGPARLALIEHYRWFFDHVNYITGVRNGDCPAFISFSPFNELNWTLKWGAPDVDAERSLNAEIKAAIKLMAPYVKYTSGQANYGTAAYDVTEVADMHAYAARSPSGRKPNPTPTVPGKVNNDIWIRRSTLGDMPGNTYGNAFSWVWGHRQAGKLMGHSEVGVGVSDFHQGTFFVLMGILGALHDSDFMTTFPWRYNKSVDRRPGDLSIQGYPTLMLQHELVALIREFGGIEPMPEHVVPYGDPTKPLEWRSVGVGPSHGYATRRMVVDPNAPPATPIPALTNWVDVLSSPGVEWDFETGNVTIERPGLLMTCGVIPDVKRIGAMTLEADRQWYGTAAWITTNGEKLVEGSPSNFYSWVNSLPKDFKWIDGLPGEYWSFGSGPNFNTNMPPNLVATLRGQETRVLRPAKPKIVLA